MVMKGSLHEDYFRDSRDTIRQQIWRERIAPYITDDPVYRVITYFEYHHKMTLNFVYQISLKFQTAAYVIMHINQTFHLKIKSPCAILDMIAEKDSYAAYLGNNFPNGEYYMCESYITCKVKVVPYVISEYLGGGWTFAKDSSFLPIFTHYVRIMKESGSFNRIESSYNERKGMPSQVCPSYEGKPIGMKKVFSVFVILLLASGLSFLILM